MSLVITPLPEIPIIRPGDDLADIVLNSLRIVGVTLRSGDILVLAQKIVSKAENRFFNLGELTPSLEALRLAEDTEKDPRIVELILRESNMVLRTRPGAIIVEHRLGFVCANAGIDHSNVLGEGNESEEWVLLLPEDPDASAGEIRSRLEKAANVRLGVLIIDSHGRAWREGTVGVAVGFSGIPGLVDLRGQKDLFEYTLRITQVGAADELAAAASLMMGQANEGTPIMHVRGFPYPLRDGCLKELLRTRETDLFR